MGIRLSHSRTGHCAGLVCLWGLTVYGSEQGKRRRNGFTALLHHVTVDLLRMAYLKLKRDAAPGVDGTTWHEYGQGVEAKLVDLHGRLHRGAYRAQPSRRKFIRKEDGRQRPLGIASLEDKIVQRAVVEVLNAIYEQDFLGFSYGFRPGRGQHDALDALAFGITRTKVSWIVDADVRSFFDSMSHDWLIRFVEHRVGDPRMIRLTRKWLKAGVMDGAEWSSSELGSPQGSVISPMLANICFHYSFDLWADQWRRHRACGNVVFVRYADDNVAGFEHEHDAKRFLKDLRERLEKFALSLHPEKTRLLEFGRFAAERRAKRGLDKPETFNFLGFTHICGHSRAASSFSTAKRGEIECALDCEPLKKDCGVVCMLRFMSRDDGWVKWCAAILLTMLSRPTPGV